MGPEVHDCAVVGAGIAGLACAQELTKNGMSCVVLEKARGVGGRLATRRIQDRWVFDHGAQFITLREPAFRAQFEIWEEEEVVFPWFVEHGRPRFCAHSGMTSIAKWLAFGQDVRLQSRVLEIQKSGGLWQLSIEDSGTAERYTLAARRLVLTAPLPQSLELCAAHASTEALSALESIQYKPCIAVMLALSEEYALESIGPIRDGLPEGLRLLSDNKAKGISPEPCLTIHLRPQLSSALWSEPDDVIVARVRDLLAQYRVEPRVEATSIQRWRYSEPIKTFPDLALSISQDPPLILAGDSFGGARVEGAYISGLHAAALLG